MQPETRREYLAEFVYGGIDGAITTLAVIAGAFGASLSAPIILILGFANLFADGFSMGVSNYLSTKSDNELAASHPHEHYDTKHPLRGATATFISFVIVGFIPLAPFLFAALSDSLGDSTFIFSIFATGLAFLFVGAIKGSVTGKSKIRSALITLFIGGIAAAIAFGVGYQLNQWFGAS